MEDLILKLQEEVKKELYDEPTGHDYYHSIRVMKTAELIAKYELEKGKNVDLFIVKTAALLHDVRDWKWNEEEEARKYIQNLLKKYSVSQEKINEIVDIVQSISFKGLSSTKGLKKLEAKIVRDADWIDALGAIGIARCFATSGKLGQVIYDPNISPKPEMDEREYKKRRTTAINHFYEKLLKLPEIMETTSGKKIAEERVKKMEEYLKWFFEEWELKDVNRLLNL